MAVAIKLWGLASGTVDEHSKRFVKAMDFEAHDGRGELTTTDDQAEAMQFPSMIEAMEFWKTSPQCHPIRLSDGRPNRPLTAYTVSVEPIEDAG
jgi:hypothetical protein